MRNSFISKVKDFKRITFPLGDVERHFLFLFSHKDLTAYQIFQNMNSEESSMAYPNVLKRVKRLEKLGLIEFKQKSKRNAKEYKLTTRGLLECLLVTRIDIPLLIRYRENIILQVILFRYFDTWTIFKFRQTAYRKVGILIIEYIRDCSETILNQLEHFRRSSFINAKKIEEYEYAINNLIESKAIALAYQILKLGSDRQVNRWLVTTDDEQHSLPSHIFDGDKDDGKDKTDKKFISFLQKIKKDFDERIENFLS